MDPDDRPAVLPLVANHGRLIADGRLTVLLPLQAARSAGLGAVRLHTQRLMASNIALYERLGYAITTREAHEGRWFT